MTDAAQNYRRAFALNAIAATMADEGRSVFNQLDAEAIWAVVGLLDAHASTPPAHHAEVTTPHLDGAQFDVPGNPVVTAVSQVLDKAA